MQQIALKKLNGELVSYVVATSFEGGLFHAVGNIHGEAEWNINAPRRIEAQGISREEVDERIDDLIDSIEDALMSGLKETIAVRHRQKYSRLNYQGLQWGQSNRKENFCHSCRFGVGPTDPICLTCRGYVCLRCVSCGCSFSNWYISKQIKGR